MMMMRREFTRGEICLFVLGFVRGRITNLEGGNFLFSFKKTSEPGESGSGTRVFEAVWKTVSTSTTFT